MSGIVGRLLRPSTGGGGGAALAALHASHSGRPGPSAGGSSASNDAWQEGQATFMLSG
jgi:hypothetical protein